MNKPTGDEERTPP